MSGLIFLTALVLCLWACVWIAKKLGNLVPNPAWRTAVKAGIFIALLASPFVDEVIGKYQFEALCKANGIQGADVSKARGRSVKIHDAYFDWHAITGEMLPTEETETQIKDADTDDVLGRFKNYRTKGGWLMRYTPLGMGSPQSMLFGSSTCDWTVTLEVMKNNNMTWIKN